MGKMIRAFCFMSLAAIASHAAAATTFHVYATAPNVSPDYSTLQAAITASLAGDTISIDDSTTYTFAAQVTLNKSNLSIVAKAGEQPVIRHTQFTGAAVFSIQNPGIRIGSLDGGTITFDGAGGDQRVIDFALDNTARFTGPSTTTLENLVFKNNGVNASNAAFFAVRVYGSATALLPANTVLNFRYLDFQFPTGLPASSVTPTRTSDYVAFLLRPQGGVIVNLENVRSNTLTGYFMTLGDENLTTNRNISGVVNMKNCKVVFDDPAIVGDSRMGCPIAVMNMYTNGTAAKNGFTLNMDNCYIRTDATKTGTLNEANIYPAHTSADTSNSLGAISLLNYANNVLNIQNSAIVAKGAGINVDTTHSAITLTNSDIYVPSADEWVTPGYFINMSARSVSIANDHQCTATRCNLYGLAGSQIKAGSRSAGSAFKMVTCNDWSGANAYASDWVTSDCVQPGANPGYGNNSDPTAAIAAADFTVYNNSIRVQNIGANREFNFGVPVELSSFSVQ